MPRVCGPASADSHGSSVKVTDRTIVIVKDLPILQCERCSEYSLEDATFAKVEQMLAQADKAAELEIVPFAA